MEYKHKKELGKLLKSLLKTKLICGKCNTLQDMTKKFYGKKENEFSWWCPNCKDRINQGAVTQALPNVKKNCKEGK